MKRLLPYPLLAASLALMWLLLAGFSRGQILLAVIVSVAACQALKALGENSPTIRHWLVIPELAGIILYDVARSNVAVAWILLTGRRRAHKSGFVAIHLRLRNPTGLAILAIVLTSTPGTAWLDYNSTRGELLIHVFDLVDEDEWIDLIANRYERRLMEIFE
jgi:multicomponent K+:H+ antiporter subunit E